MAAMATRGKKQVDRKADVAINASQRHRVSSRSWHLSEHDSAGAGLHRCGDAAGCDGGATRQAIGRDVASHLNGSNLQALSGLFQLPIETRGSVRLRPDVDSINNVSMDQNVQRHTNGTRRPGPTANAVNGAGTVRKFHHGEWRAAITRNRSRGSKITFGGIQLREPVAAGYCIAAQFTVTAT